MVILVGGLKYMELLWMNWDLEEIKYLN